MERVLVIYDSDFIYTERMMDYIRKNKLKGFDFRAFTDKNLFMKYMENHNIDLLVSSDRSIIEASSKKVRKTIYLGNKVLVNPDEKQSEVYKYQSVTKVLSQIMSYYTDWSNKDTNSLEDKPFNLEVISVFAPRPHIYNSQYAWSLAENSSYNSKVLFFPLEALPTNAQYKNSQSKQGLSEFIYYLKENRSDLMSIMDSCLSYHGGISYLAGLSHGFDLMSLGKEDAKNLLGKLRESKKYDLIIFYLGIYTEFSQEIVGRSNTCYVPLANEEYEHEVYEEWMRQMNFAGHQISALKHCKVGP